MNEYLPSKQFTIRVIIILVFVGLVFGIYKAVVFFKNKSQSKDPLGLVIKSDVIQKDSNGNEIPDWEESLWGLDPAGDGKKNKEFILVNRETLARENGSTINNNEPLSENETLSREFFSVIMSLQESGDLDEVSMNAIGDTIGQKIIATPIPDIYTKDMLLTIKTNPANTQAYYNKLSSTMTKYSEKDIGKELTFISVGLANSDHQALDQAKAVALSYHSFAKELLKIQVPTPLIATHLSLVNNYEKVAKSIEEMTQMLVDPIVGMKALINYKKYTDALVADIEILSKSIE